MRKSIFKYYTRFIQYLKNWNFDSLWEYRLSENVGFVLWFVFFFAFKNVEYQMSLPSDDERACMLYGSLAKEGHPMGKFFTGNLMSVWPNTIDVCIVCDLWSILNLLSDAYGNLYCQYTKNTFVLQWLFWIKFCWFSSWSVLRNLPHIPKDLCFCIAHY